MDGQCQTLPCEPQPLALSAASGLNRLQQLLAAQAVVAPAIPSFSGVDGGVVGSAAIPLPEAALLQHRNAK